MAGLAGRCRKCGRETIIPEGSEPEVMDLDSTQHVHPPEKDNGHIPEERPQFCPFCGNPTTPDAMLCANCLKILRPARPSLEERSRLTMADWVLATALAPLGLMAGFIGLITGNRKGLDVMGVSAVSIFFWWLVLVVMGWLR